MYTDANDNRKDVDKRQVYLFVNEGDNVYEGSAAIPDKRACCVYDAWENTVYGADAVWAVSYTHLDVYKRQRQ